MQIRSVTFYKRIMSIERNHKLISVRVGGLKLPVDSNDIARADKIGGEILQSCTNI